MSTEQEQPTAEIVIAALERELLAAHQRAAQQSIAILQLQTKLSEGDEAEEPVA